MKNKVREAIIAQQKRMDEMNLLQLIEARYAVDGAIEDYTRWHAVALKVFNNLPCLAAQATVRGAKQLYLHVRTQTGRRFYYEDEILAAILDVDGIKYGIDTSLDGDFCGIQIPLEQFLK